MIASNGSGPRRRLYGTARDLVIGMKFATLEGKLVQSGGMVVKNVAGLDMAKLMIGSFGTLAAIAVVNLKLAPAPEVERSFLLAFESLSRRHRRAQPHPGERASARRGGSAEPCGRRIAGDGSVAPRRSHRRQPRRRRPVPEGTGEAGGLGGSRRRRPMTPFGMPSRISRPTFLDGEPAMEPWCAPRVP